MLQTTFLAFRAELLAVSAWGLALLAGGPCSVVAQQLPVAMPALSTHIPLGNGPVYPPTLAQYRRLKVRTVLVQRHFVADPPAGNPVRPAGYYEYDPQGRPVRWYETNGTNDQPALIRRYDLTYRPAGELATTTSWERLPALADTSQLGHTWLAVTVTRHPPLPGTGYTATWRDYSGDWEVTTRLRSWQSHDTLYQTTTNAITGLVISRERTYAMPDQLARHDRLLFGDRSLAFAIYTYQRFDTQHHLLELGKLDFSQVYQPANRFGLPTLAQDELGRHAAGQLRPHLTQTFGPDGRQQTGTSAFGGKLTFSYDAKGRLAEIQHTDESEAPGVWRYTFLPSGLPASIRLFNPEGQLRTELLYRYTYYQ